MSLHCHSVCIRSKPSIWRPSLVPGGHVLLGDAVDVASVEENVPCVVDRDDDAIRVPVMRKGRVSI